MMRTRITQKNLYLILPAKVSRMAEMLSEDNGIDIVEAVKEVYCSDTYKSLEKERTKQWHLGPVALYEEMVEQ